MKPWEREWQQPEAVAGKPWEREWAVADTIVEPAAEPASPEESFGVPMERDPIVREAPQPQEPIDLDALKRKQEAYEEQNPFLTRMGQRFKRGAMGSVIGEHVGNAITSADTILRAQTDADLGPEERATKIAKSTDNLATSLALFAKYQKQAMAIPEAPVVSEARGRGLKENLRAASVDPIGFIAEHGATSAFPSAQMAVDAAVGGRLAGKKGAVGGAGASSFNVDYLSQLVEAIASTGVDTTNPEAVKQTLLNPEFLAQAKKSAGLHAGVVGLFDALSIGLASKVMAPSGIKSPLAREAINLPAQTATQGVAGGAGEAGGQLLDKGRVDDWSAVVAEVAGEAVTAPGDVAAAAVGGIREKQKRAREEAESRRIAEEVMRAGSVDDAINKAAVAAGTSTEEAAGPEFTAEDITGVARRRLAKLKDYRDGTPDTPVLDANGRPTGEVRKGVGPGIRRPETDAEIAFLEQNMTNPEALATAYGLRVRKAATEPVSVRSAPSPASSQPATAPSHPGVHASGAEMLPVTPEDVGTVQGTPLLGKGVSGAQTVPLSKDEKRAMDLARTLTHQYETPPALLNKRPTEPAVKPAEVPRETPAKRVPNLLETIAKLGGVNIADKMDIIGDTKGNKKIPYVGNAFTKKGDSLDGMAERLSGLGWFTEAERNSGEATRKLSEMIRDEMTGVREHIRPGNLSDLDARMEAERARYYEEMEAVGERQEDDDPFLYNTEADLSISGYTRADEATKDLAALFAVARQKMGDDAFDALLERVAASNENASDEEFEALIRAEIENHGKDQTQATAARAESGGHIAPTGEVVEAAQGQARAEEEVARRVDAAAESADNAASPQTPKREPVASAGTETPSQEGVSVSGRDVRLTPVSKRPPAQDNLLGGRNETAQAIHDARAERERKERSAPDMAAGPGDLFSDKGKQADIEDVRGVKDRRRDTARRKAVSEMSPDELRRELLTDPLTSLPNRRAYEEAAKKPVQVAIDVDSLKWVNDNLGHEAGDQLLKAMGQALAESGLEAYHISGDEFMVQGDDQAPIETMLEDVTARLDNAELVAETPDGSTVTKRGVHFSYGIGATRNEADQALNRAKKDREAQGLRAPRGQEPPGVARTAQGQSPEVDQAPAEEVDQTPSTEGVSASEVDAAAHEAATSPENATPEPTEAQKKAGNYQKGHVSIAGLDISIENPEGSKRRPEWPTLKSHYGYIKGTVGKDKDHIDVFVKPGTAEDYAGPVFVVDQTNKEGDFDEHKVMLGWPDEAAAREGYLENYTPGWSGLGAIKEFTLSEFKLWLKAGNTKKAVAYRKADARLTPKSKRQSEALPPSYWRVALGLPRAMEIGIALGYERVGQSDMVRVRFPDGSEDLFTPHQLFPAKKEDFEAAKEQKDERLTPVSKREPASPPAETREFKETNPFAEKVYKLRRLLAKFDRRSQRDKDMEHHFPLGVGFGRGTKRDLQRIDSTVKRAGLVSRLRRDLDYAEAQAKAYDEGKINAQGRNISPESIARSEKRESQKEKREARIAAAKAARGDKPAWQTPKATYADSTGYLGGSARSLVESGHREAVEKALAEGKDVPAEVLADYPDLKPQEVSAQESGSLFDPMPMPSAIERLSDHEKEKYGAVAPIEPDRNIEALEKTLHQMFLLREAATKGNGKLLARVHSASLMDVISNWRLHNGMAMGLAEWRQKNPEQWQQYLDRQRDVADAKKGDKLITPYGDTVTLVKKHPKNWSVLHQYGQETKYPPSVLRPTTEVSNAAEAAPEQATETPAETSTAKAEAAPPELPANVAPHFETYDEAQKWIAQKEREYGSKREFSASEEYKAAYEHIRALYDAERAQEGKDAMTALAAAGLKVGDKVKTFVPGAFLSGATFTGTITERAGRPYVKLDGGEIPVSRGGKLTYQKSVAWDARWKKVDEAASAKGEPASDVEATGQSTPSTEVNRAESAKPETPVAVHDAFLKRLYDGEVTVEEFKQAFEAVVANEAAITAELSKLTKDALLKRLGGYAAYQYKNDKKDRIVAKAYDDMVTDFNLEGSLAFSPFSAGGYKAGMIAAVRAKVEATTAEQLADYAAAVKKAREERKEKAAAMIEAVKDPKTLEDFETFLRVKKREDLTPEQRIRYDEMRAEKSRTERLARQKEQRTTVRAAGATTGAEIIATKHTQKGHDLFVVKPAERVERDVYNAWNAAAKKLGGYYSSYNKGGAVPGFQFKTREAAEAFQKFVSGGDTAAVQEQAKARRDAFEDDRSQTAVERLREMAEKLDERADESLSRERKANTERRARMAAAAEAEANYQKSLAATMRNIAQAIEDGKAKFLDRVRQKVQVEMLNSMVRRAKDNELRAKYKDYGEQEKHKHDKPTAETIEHADWPTYTAYRSDLANLGRKLLEVEGLKLIGQRILKVADDVTDAYTKWAKDNLFRVARFTTKDGARPAFRTADAAWAAIERSGYGGKAIPLQIKRGEHTIVMSPSEARREGLWQGDDDKRITLTSDFGAELVEKASRRARRGDREIVPWQFQTAYEQRKRFAAMGIETAAEFRTALREFIQFREAPQAPDKVKELERKLVGRRKDGLDFFPTPAALADEMIKAAELQEGMAVLEPSAGMGHIADRLREAGYEPDVVELSGERRELLEAKGYRVVANDFMDMSPRGFTYGDTFRDPEGKEGILRGLGGMGSNRVRLVNDAGEAIGYYDYEDLTPVKKNGHDSGYDRIIMNPPFSDRRDMAHVQHAYELLKPGGRLVAIVGEGVFFGRDSKATEFRAWLEKVGGTDEKIEEGTFQDPTLPVTTGVNARMVVIDKDDTEVSFDLADADAPAAPFYSQMERVLEQKLPNSTTAKEMALMVQAYQRKGDIKKEELEWSGLLEWLAAQDGRITKDRVLEFVRANRIEVEEVVKGGSVPAVEAIALREKIFDFWHSLNDSTPAEHIVDDALAGSADAIGALEMAGAPDEILDPLHKYIAATKFGQYQLPGGENYRELLLTLPASERSISEEDVLAQAKVDAAGAGWIWEAMSDDSRNRVMKAVRLRFKKNSADFRSSHFDEPNVLAHVRFNERTDADGKRVLFIEEIQSDWHQQGRKQGYKVKAPSEEEMKAAHAAAREVLEANDFLGFDHAVQAINAIDEHADWRERWEVPDPAHVAVLERVRALRAQNRQARIGVPDAPFKTTWPMLAFKRALRWAVDNGFDRVAWTTGEQQNERYDLSKQVAWIRWYWNDRKAGTKIIRIAPLTGNVIELGINAEGIASGVSGGRSGTEFDGKHITDIVGKDIGEKILADPHGDLSGSGLKIGGTGMAGFYDQILPKEVGKYVKKWGATVDKTKIDVGGAAKFKDGSSYNSTIIESVHAVDITDAMRAAVAQGQALFRIADGQAQGQPVKRFAAKEIEAGIAKIVKNWKNAPPVHVVQRMEDLPERTYRKALHLNAHGIRGAFVRSGGQDAVYLVADNMPSVERAQMTLLHEVVGHYGLRGAFGKEWESTLRRIYLYYGPSKLAYLKEAYKFDFAKKEDQLKAADEHFARLAERYGREELKGRELTFFEKIVLEFKNLLRRLGFTVKMGRAEWLDLANAMNLARRYVEGGTPGDAVGEGQRFALREPAEAMAADTDTAPKLKTDNPGGSWLRDKRMETIEEGRTEHGPYRRMGSVTGYYNGPVRVPVSVLATIKGMRGEQGRVRQASLDHLKKVMQETGRLPTYEIPNLGVFENVPFIQVDQDGVPWVNEGNHRIMAAAALGWKSLPVEVRYFNGGERLPGPLSPEKIREYAKQEAPDTRLAADTASSEAFKRWFGDSKVVDENGKPMVVYHGTPARRAINQFKTPAYFTDEPSFAEMFAIESGEDRGALYPVYLAIENPKRIDGDVEGRHFEWDAIDVRRMKAEGHDGVIVTSSDGSTIYTVFDPEQIKSAIGNRGTFDPNHPDISFDTGDTDRAPGLPEYHRRARDWVFDWLKTQKKVNLWSRSVGSMYHLAHKVPIFKPVFDTGQNFLADTSRIAIEAEDEAPGLFRKMGTLKQVFLTGRASDKDVAAIAVPIYRGTIIDEKVYSYDELRTAFGLTPKQIALYQQAIDATRKSLDDVTTSALHRMLGAMGLPRPALTGMARASRSPSVFLENVYQTFLKPTREDIADQIATLETQIETAGEDVRGAIEAELAAVREQKTALDADIANLYKTLARVKKLKKEGYFPLMRFGKYSVDVVEVDESGRRDRIAFMTFEHEHEANAAARALREEYPDAEVTQGVMSQDDWRLFPGLTPDVVEAFARAVGADESDLFQQYLKIAVGNRSAMKRLIRRKSVPGFSRDVNRTLATFILANARLASANYNMPDMMAAIQAIPKEQGDVRDKGVQLRDYLLNPSEEFAGLRGFLFFDFIGGSLASALTNLTQVPMATLPYLGQFGNVRAAKAIAKWMKPGTKPAEGSRHARDLKRAEEEGIVSPQEVYNLMATARGGRLGTGKVLSSRTVQASLYLWGLWFSLAEQYNRRVTFNAAYDMALKRGEADPYAFAVKAVDETQFIYNRGNRPMWARGIGAPIFTFKQFVINYVELYKRLPAKQKALMVALLIIAAGLRGLPFEEDAEDILDTIMQWAGYNWHTRAEMEKWAHGVLGERLGDFMLEGVSGLGLPIDVQARLGLGNLIPGTAILKMSEGDKTREAADVLGVATNVARNVGIAVERTAKGDVAGAAKALSPKAAMHVWQAIEMATEGKYLDSQKRPLVETTVADAVMKGIGFNPRRVALAQKSQRLVRDMENLQRVVEDGIADRWARGIFFEDEELVEEAIKARDDWNEKNPDLPLFITGRQIGARVRQMTLDADTRAIRQAPRELRQRVMEEMEKR